jgi:hypothetical protein
MSTPARETCIDDLGVLRFVDDGTYAGWDGADTNYPEPG